MKRYASVSSINISSNRQRRQFDEEALRELVESIQRPAGLLHPLVCRLEDDKYILVAGERRLRAIQDIYALGGTFNFAGEPVLPGMVPFTLLQDLDPIQIMEAELEENTIRRDLTWQERANAMSQLAELRKAQAAASNSPPPTIVSLTAETRGTKYTDTTRKELMVARHLDDPDVQGAKSLDEAVKTLKRKEERKRNAELAVRIGENFSSKDHLVVQQDAETWAMSCKSDRFDVILTDPPYGMGADGFGDAGGKTSGGHSYTDSEDILSHILSWFPEQSFRIAKQAAHLYLFCDIDWFHTWRDALSDAGWKVFRTPLIWFKPSAYRAPWPEQGPQRKYELILYAVKGDKKCTALAGDVIECPPDENLGHNAQKPVALYQELLRRSARPGERVLDLFAGSGPLIPAAHSLKCSATCVEIDQASAGMALGRLRALDNPNYVYEA